MGHAIASLLTEMFILSALPPLLNWNLWYDTRLEFLKAQINVCVLDCTVPVVL